MKRRMLINLRESDRASLPKLTRYVDVFHEQKYEYCDLAHRSVIVATFVLCSLQEPKKPKTEKAKESPSKTKKRTKTKSTVQIFQSEPGTWRSCTGFVKQIKNIRTF